MAAVGDATYSRCHAIQRCNMAELDVDAMVGRFRDRAQAVRDRPLPPVAGSERQKFVAQAETDYLDYALVGNATWEVEDNHLVLRIPLSQED